jgi:antitoxin HigA-1
VILKNPKHPGAVIRTTVLEPLGLSVTDAAKALEVSRPALSNLLNENASLTAEMALRIEKAFGPKMDHLMRMQLAYDLAQARKRTDTIQVKRYRRA